MKSRTQRAKAALLLVLATLHVLWAAPDTQKSVEVHIPEHPAEGEVYLCTRVPLPNVPQRLVAIEPLSKQDVVHHMILYGEHYLHHVRKHWPQPVTAGKSSLKLWSAGRSAE